MQGVTGACTCSVCPTQPSRATVPPDTQQEVLSGLLNGELAPDGFGTLTRRGEYIDKKYRPGRRDAGLDGVILALATESITLVPPKLYENGMLLMQRLYQHSKLTKQKLEKARVAPAEDSVPLTFYDALAFQIMKGPQRAANIAISLTRSLIRDAKAASRMSCLLWKKSKKDKAFLGIFNLLARLGSKQESLALQEDSIRILACLGNDQERILRMAAVKPVLKAFCKVIDDGAGTDKSIDTALWLTWRMTRDNKFCERLTQNSEMMNSLVRWACTVLDEEALPGLREENALAILANVSVQEGVCQMILERYPRLLESAAVFIELGSPRGVEVAALLIGNLAFNDEALDTLAAVLDRSKAVPRLLSVMIQNVQGGDRARELGALALANLSRMDIVVNQLLAEEGAMEVILSVRESGATGRAREAAERVIANCSIFRLQSMGVTKPMGQSKVHSYSIFNDTTVRTQHKIKQFGPRKSMSFSPAWVDANLKLCARFPEIAARSQSQLGMRSQSLLSMRSQSSASIRSAGRISMKSLALVASVGTEYETVVTHMPPLVPIESSAHEAHEDAVMAEKRDVCVH